MENRMNLSNKEKAVSLLKWTLRKNLAFSIVYCILLFLSFPMIEIFGLVVCASEGNMSDYTNSIDQILPMLPASVFAAVAIIFSTVITIIVFSYMHNKRKVDLFGSFPLSRRTLFFVRFAAAVILTVIPVVVIGLVGGMLGLSNFAIIETFKVIGLILLAVIGNIGFVALISVCCGTVADVIISYIVINGIWPLCVAVCYWFPSSVIPGMSAGDMPTNIYTLLTPSSSFFTLMFGSGKVIGIVWWALFIIVSITACYFLCKKRKAEVAQNAFAFSVIEIIIKFITCFVSGFGLGYMLAHLGLDRNSIVSQYTWFFVGAIIAVMTANILLHIIFHRGLKKYSRSLIECGAVLASITVFLFIVTSGAFGYDTRVPKTEEIDKVSIKTEDLQSFYINGVDILENYTSDKQVIDCVLQIHRSAVENVKKAKSSGLLSITNRGRYVYGIIEDDEDNTPYTDNIKIEYKLKNGRSVVRTYKYPYTGNMKDTMNKLRKTDYYQKSINFFEKIPDKYVDEIVLSQFVKTGDVGSSYETMVSDVGKNENEKYIKDFVKAFGSDIKQHGTYSSRNQLKDEECFVADIIYKNNDTDSASVTERYYIPKKYVNTMNVLKQYGYDNFMLNHISGELGSSIGNDTADMYDISYSKTDTSIYFKVPDDWDKSIDVRCVVMGNTESILYGMNTDITLCTKLDNGIYQYNIPQIEYMDYSIDDGKRIVLTSYPKVLFYQYKENYFKSSGIINTGCEDTNSPKKMNNKLLSLGKQKRANKYSFEKPKYEYKWGEYMNNK